MAASDVLTVKAHTGHAIHLRRDGVVMGTGGNRFGPLSSHGLGDTADRWGRVFDSAVAIATGSRHSLALRADGSLWAWGEGFKGEPAKLLDAVVAVAAGDTATLARWHARSMARCGNGTAAVHHAGWCCVSRFQRGGQRTGRLGAPALGKRTLALSRRLAAMGATRIFRHEDYELACTASVDDGGKFVPAVAVAVAKQAWPRRPRNIAVPRGEYVTEEDAARAQGIDWIANYG